MKILCRSWYPEVTGNKRAWVSMGLETYSLKSGFQAAESQESREMIENWALLFTPPTPKTKTCLLLFGGHTNASKSDVISIGQVLNTVPNKIAWFSFLLPPPLNIISQALMMNLSQGGLVECLCRHCRLQARSSKLEDLWAHIFLPEGEEHKYTVNYIINENVNAVRTFEVWVLGSKGRKEKSQDYVSNKMFWGMSNIGGCTEHWTKMQMGKWKTFV